MKLFLVTSASLLLWMTTCVAAEEACTIPPIPNGVAGKYVKVRFSRRTAEVFKKVDEGTAVKEGDYVYLRCSEGYKVSGTDRNETKMDCREGRWTDELHCTGEACTIPSIPNGVAGKYVKVRFSRRITEVFKKVDEGTEVNEGEDVYLRCSEGYKVSGTDRNETKMDCREGRWTDKLHCTGERCKDLPPIPEYGSIIGLSTKIGAIVNYTCEDPYVLSGDSIVRCFKGEWVGEPPECRNSSCQADTPMTFFGKVQEVEVDRRHGGSITYECLPDHVMVRNRTVTCEYGEWKGYPPKCKSIKCATDALMGSFGVMREPNQIFFDDEVYNYTCQSPEFYKPEENSGIAKCTDGMWHVDLPLCREKRCFDSPPIPERGSVVDQSSINGAIVNYTCEDPYVLVGDSIVQCINGDWVGEPPECRDSMCYVEDLGNLMHISLETEESALSGDKLDVKCEAGYSFQGELPKCENGSWNTHFLESPCREISCVVPDVFYGKLKEVVHQGHDYSLSHLKYPNNGNFRMVTPGKSLPSDTVLYLCCEHGYSFRGSGAQVVRTRCIGGRWLPHPECQLSFPRKKGGYRGHPMPWYTLE